MPYLFKSERLGFRNWQASDLEELAQLNANSKVMRHFPKTLKSAESAAFMHRMQKQFEAKGYCYFAVEELKSGSFIGFIGLSDQDYPSPFNPSTDIGWRLAAKFWGLGYATEGALACLDFAFHQLKKKRITSTCPLSNKASERVMQKIGMKKMGLFLHPKLKEQPHLEKCVWYEISISDQVLEHPRPEE